MHQSKYEIYQVYRHPVLGPWDIHKWTAKKPPQWMLKRKYRMSQTLVCSKKMGLLECSGGDYDGDLVHILTDKTVEVMTCCYTL